MRSYFDDLRDLSLNRQEAVICTLVDSKGSTPAKAGSKLIVKEDGSILGTIGGGQLERKVYEEALLMLKENSAPRLVQFNLVKDLQMCCGGQVSVFMERLLVPIRLVIFGAGHVGHALANLASTCGGFEIHLVDDRKEFLDTSFLPEDVSLKLQSPILFAEQFPWDLRSFAVILTYEHSLDREILKRCIKKSIGFLGMIGSSRKVAITRKLFLENDIATECELSKVRMPVGLNIGAHSPGEIAVSILAELILVSKSMNSCPPTKIEKRKRKIFREDSAICPFPDISISK